MGRKGTGLKNDRSSYTMSLRLSQADRIMLEKLASGTKRSKTQMIVFLIQEGYQKETGLI